MGKRPISPQKSQLVDRVERIPPTDLSEILGRIEEALVIEYKEGITDAETRGLSPEERIKLIIEKVEEQVRGEFEGPDLVVRAVLEGLLGISWFQLNTEEQTKIRHELDRYDISI